MTPDQAQTIINLLRLNNALLALVVSEQYRIAGGGNPGGYPADVTGILARAVSELTAWQSREPESVMAVSA